MSNETCKKLYDEITKLSDKYKVSFLYYFQDYQSSGIISNECPLCTLNDAIDYVESHNIQHLDHSISASNPILN